MDSDEPASARPVSTSPDELQRSDALIRVLTEYSQDLVAILAPDLSVLYSSPSYERILGAPLAELQRQPGGPLTFIHPDDQAMTHAALQRCLAGVQPVTQAMVRVRHANGTWHTLETTFSNHVNDPAIGGIVLTSHDISGHLSAAAASLTNDEPFRALFDNALIGMAVVSLDGHFVQVNAALCDVLGYSVGELLTKSAQDITPPGELAETERTLEWYRAGMLNEYHIEKHYIHADGHLVWVQNNSRLVRDTTGQPLYILNQTHDISARKRAEEALRTSEQLLRSVTDNAPILLAAFDQAGIFTVCTGQALAKLGIVPGESVGQSLFSRYAAFPEICQAARDVLAGQECSCLSTISGSVFSLRFAPILVADDQVAGGIVVGTDMTDYMQTLDTLLATQQRLNAILANMPVTVNVFDREGTYVLSEGHALATVGRKPGEVVGQSLASVYADQPELIERLHRALAGENLTTYTEVSGHIFESHWAPWRDHNGEIVGAISVAIDVTERHRAEESLRASEAYFRALIERAPIGACLIDEHGYFETVNAAYCALVGYTRDELIGRHFSLIFADAARAAMSELYLKYLATHQDQADEYTITTKDGQQRTVLSTPITFTGIDGHLKRATFIVDLTDRKRMEQHLSHLAHHDSLTGLPNRLFIGDYLPRVLAQAQRQSQLVALLFVDLDGFKTVNDTLGHDRGDTLLRAVAQRLTTCIRTGDMVARLAGDEFIVILTNIGAGSNAERVANKIGDTVGRDYTLDNEIAAVTCSIGIALFPFHGYDLDTLIKAADIAMYAAKQEGKNTYRFATT